MNGKYANLGQVIAQLDAMFPVYLRNLDHHIKRLAILLPPAGHPLEVVREVGPNTE